MLFETNSSLLCFLTGIQHLLINRNFKMVQQRTNDDDKDMKPKLLEGTYLKMSGFPTEFNVVSTNNMAGLNASAVTSKHNYSLPPQAAFHHHQPITLQSQNKVIINSAQSHSGSGNITIGTPIQDMQNKITIPTSNLKLNIVPSLAQVMQSGLVIDAKSLGASGSDQKTTTILTTAPTNQHHYQQQQSQQSQPQGQQMQGQQHKVKIEKTVNMMFDADRNRILYTNIKNNRGGQFLAQINPKVVNILPIQHKNNMTATVQGIVTPSGILNKNLQRMVASPSNVQNQSMANLRQTVGSATTNIGIAANVPASSTTAVIIGTSSGNVVGGVSGGHTSNITLNTMNTNVGNSVVNMNVADNSLAAKFIQSNNDGTTSSAINNININTTNR